MLSELAVRVVEEVVDFFVTFVSDGVLEFLMALLNPGASLV